MKKISDALRDLISENRFLQFGLSHRLLNLSQLSRYLKPLVEARVKKDIEETAITMNLSRLQKSLSIKETKDKKKPQIANIIVHSSLCILTYPKQADIHAGVNKLYARIQKDAEYISISEGINEITLCIKNKYLSIAASLICQKPAIAHEDIGAIGIKFDAHHQHAPGLFYIIFEKIYFQGINIIEIASTATELIIYLAEKDVELAFDTLYPLMRN